VPHVEPVGAASARALLLLQPDFFFGDRGELVERRQRPVAAGAVGTGKVLLSSIISSLRLFL
jgi:hypothetical protein